eukprot:407878-Karenia_brevis.AAC.1
MNIEPKASSPSTSLSPQPSVAPHPGTHNDVRDITMNITVSVLETNHTPSLIDTAALHPSPCPAKVTVCD